MPEEVVQALAVPRVGGRTSGVCSETSGGKAQAHREKPRALRGLCKPARDNHGSFCIVRMRVNVCSLVLCVDVY